MCCGIFYIFFISFPVDVIWVTGFISFQLMSFGSRISLASFSFGLSLITGLVLTTTTTTTRPRTSITALIFLDDFQRSVSFLFRNLRSYESAKFSLVVQFFDFCPQCKQWPVFLVPKLRKIPWLAALSGT